METSPMFKLNTIDRKKVGKWAIIAMLGALLTYFEAWIITVDFWQFTPVVMLFNSVLVNFLNKLMTGPVVAITPIDTLPEVPKPEPIIEPKPEPIIEPKPTY